MVKKIQAIRGMHDILPDKTHLWQFVEQCAHQVFRAYGYAEIRMPLLEMTELFKRSIGEVTDIVEKEMYTFEDRNGDSLTLRPEGTASCVRAGIEHGFLHNQVRRLWYQGPMFRHERPQKGRYRQFHQIGVETFGLEGPDIDLELIVLSSRLWRELGLTGLELHLNTLGTPEERRRFRAELVDYLEAHRDRLDEDSLRRLVLNPLRILDSKNPEMQEVIAGAPRLLNHLGEESRRHFDWLCEQLDTMGIPYRVNARLVRGLDYYVGTVFEWMTGALGAQGTVCAGGRYDGLVEQLGGRLTPACGFALGVERIIALLEQGGLRAGPGDADVYVVAMGEAAVTRGFQISEQLRDQLPGVRVLTHCGGGGFKAQFKKADRSGALFAVILGDAEIAAGTAGIKPLRAAGEQETVSLENVSKVLKARLADVAQV
ncbi:MAG: histidine--tRNA ligase [Pseudomonadota bacterium]